LRTFEISNNNKTTKIMKTYTVKKLSWRLKVLDQLSIDYKYDNDNIYFKAVLDKSPVSFIISKAIELNIQTY
jgi:hypothetical protein